MQAGAFQAACFPECCWWCWWQQILLFRRAAQVAQRTDLRFTDEFMLLSKDVISDTVRRVRERIQRGSWCQTYRSSQRLVELGTTSQSCLVDFSLTVQSSFILPAARYVSAVSSRRPLLCAGSHASAESSKSSTTRPPAVWAEKLTGHLLG